MYDDFYGLSGKPFQLTPDHHFYYESQGHQRAMAYLRYGLEQGEGFIVITGGIGTGKTTLVRNLFNELDSRDIMAAELVTTQVEAEDMLRMVCASFGLAHEGMNKATLLGLNEQEVLKVLQQDRLACPFVGQAEGRHDTA
jgi:type II secretory pathway predicted ATPase ExeA